MVGTYAVYERKSVDERDIQPCSRKGRSVRAAVRALGRAYSVVEVRKVTWFDP